MFPWPSLEIPEIPLSLKPAGQELSLHNSYRGVKEVVSGSNPFTMYVCGITPYDATHLGHAATYLTFDLINRFLRATGRDVRFVENVTDIDDPLFERANRDAQDWQELGAKQIDLFRSDMTNLRILPPDLFFTVTESMPKIIAAVEKLKKDGLTYHLDGDLYLNGGEIPGFDNLPFAREEALKIFKDRGGDPDRAGKRGPFDPLLWRKSNDGEPFWETSFGAGRPGWHIECNAISAELMNFSQGGEKEVISLQGGGRDLLFPHHFMTEIQARALYGRDFARHFVHCGMIGYQGEKMSKSLGNLVFASKLVDSGIEPMAIRIALLLNHYRSDREWSDQLLKEGQRILDKTRRALGREFVPDYHDVVQQMSKALSDDLDTPRFFQIFDQYLDSALDGTEEVSPGALSRYLDAVVGLAL